MALVSDLADRLARHAEAVCRHHLLAGRRYGGQQGPVSLRASHRCASRPLERCGDRPVWSSARPHSRDMRLDRICRRRGRGAPLPLRAATEAAASSCRSTADRATLLFAIAEPISGTLAERYLQSRGMLGAADHPALRFHQSCYYRDLSTGRTTRLPRSRR